MSDVEGGGTRYRPWAVAAGPLACAVIWWLRPGGLPELQIKTLAVTAWVATWWILESVPLAATSLLPLVLLPLWSVRPADEVAHLYVEDNLFLLFGGFLLALALERWGLHKRLAVFVLSRVGGAPRRLVLGFALAACIISMWISNSATTLVLLPIALAVGRRLEGVIAATDLFRIHRAMLLAVAYGSTAGGLGTYVGTPPNLVFRACYVKSFGAGSPGGPPEISFLHWMIAFAPLALVLAVIMGLVLAHGLPRGDGSAAREAVRREAAQLPPWMAGERLVAGIFLLAALLWITREPFELGSLTLFGWSRAFPASGYVKGFVKDGTVAVTLVIACFVLRARPLPGMAAVAGSRTVPLLDWREAEAKMPWGVLLLFGGGFALGDTFQTTRLSESLGRGLEHGLGGLPAPAIVLLVCLFMIFVSEFMNNTACAQVMLPILGGVAVQLDLAPAALLVPATLAASCGFMMPAGTAPNAIAFATGRIDMRYMVRVGFVLDVVSALLVAAWVLLVALPLFGVRLDNGS